MPYYTMNSPTTSPTPVPSQRSRLSTSSASASHDLPLPVSSSSKPSRHVCPDCGRSYKAAETLNRHRKNHSETTQYVCRVCTASFKRKDLLDRHSQIHIHGSSSAGRNRSQRACTRCSRLKTRCDNLKPCTRCARGGHACTYAENRSRARTDRSTTASPSRTDEPTSGSSTMSASEALASMNLSAGVPISGASIDASASWEGGKTWAETLWTPTYPWFSQLDPAPATTSPEAMRHAFPPTTTEYDMTNWDNVFDTSSIDHFQMQLPLQNALIDASSVDSLAWAQWQQQEAAVPTSASMPFHSQFITQSNMPSELSAETGPSSVMAETARERTKTHGDVAKAAQKEFAGDMALTAANFIGYSKRPDERAAMWEYFAQRAESVFELQGLAPAGRHLLLHFIDLYCQHFHTRWPFRHEPNLEPQALPGHLYLIMATVGAAYAGGSRCANFHHLMMEHLRPHIIMAATQKPLPDDAVLPMIETLLIIQASALSFGNRKAFSFAPQIGSSVTSLCRRVNLFSDPGNLPELEYMDSSSLNNSGSACQHLEDMELRRRLAMGHLRIEVFVSLLLGTRPLISYEEVHVRSPVPDIIWLKDGAAGETALRAAMHNGSPHVFSELVRNALDPNEPLPSLRFDQLESVLFGLQPFVWRFSQDARMARLLAVDLESGSIDEALRQDVMEYSQQGLADLRNDYARTIYALKKWKRALTASAPTTLLPHERKSLLASNLLFNLSFMKLRADLPGLHRVALACIRDEQPPHEALMEAYRWVATKNASVAVESACSTWTLIINELKRPEQVRAEFDLLTHIGLLHAAVIVWVYTGVHVDPATATMMLNVFGGGDTAAVGTVAAAGGSGGMLLQTPQPEPQHNEQMRLCRTNNAWIMRSFATLLLEIRSLHATGYASYYNTVDTLARRPLPQL